MIALVFSWAESFSDTFTKVIISVFFSFDLFIASGFCCDVNFLRFMNFWVINVLFKKLLFEFVSM